MTWLSWKVCWNPRLTASSWSPIDHWFGSASGCVSCKLLVFDVDGVLTDGGLSYGPDGQIWRRFDARDGLAIKLLQQAGRSRCNWHGSVVAAANQLPGVLRIWALPTALLR